MVKNLLVMQEIKVQSLGWEDPLEEGLATHINILAWRILMGRGAWWARVHGVAKSHTRLSMSDAKHSTAHYPSTSMPSAVGHVYIRIHLTLHLFFILFLGSWNGGP